MKYSIYVVLNPQKSAQYRIPNRPISTDVICSTPKEASQRRSHHKQLFILAYPALPIVKYPFYTRLAYMPNWQSQDFNQGPCIPNPRVNYYTTMSYIIWKNATPTSIAMMTQKLEGLNYTKTKTSDKNAYCCVLRWTTDFVDRYTMNCMMFHLHPPHNIQTRREWTRIRPVYNTNIWICVCVCAEGKGEW